MCGGSAAFLTPNPLSRSSWRRCNSQASVFHLKDWQRASSCSSSGQRQLARVRRVTYDVGPTFDKRYPEPGADGQRTAEVQAYGNFTASAWVELADDEVEVLHVDVVLADGKGRFGLHTEQPQTLSSKPKRSWLPAAIGIEVPVAASVLALSWLTIVAWPDGSSFMNIFRWSLPISLDTRLLLLATASAGLGALLQAAYTLASYPTYGSIRDAWTVWYWLRAPTGMLLGIFVYFLLRVGFVPDVEPRVLFPIGLAVAAFLVGLSSSRVTSKLRDFLQTLRENVEDNQATDDNGGAPMVETVSAESADAAREAQRKADIALGQTVLRGKHIVPQEIYNLAEQLRKVNEFGLARRLYGRIREQADWMQLKQTAALVGQRHALSTYKDPDLPAAERFARALEILDEVDQFDLRAPPASLSPGEAAKFDRDQNAVKQRQESLGLRGAVHKRRWQTGGQHVDLERSLGFY